MNLFDKIPENLFSILSSKNKGIYIDALFVVKECFKFDLNVSRGVLSSALMSSLEEEIYDLDASEDEDGISQGADLSSKANFIIRKLLETKWIMTEFRGSDFESVIELPDYSKRILDVLEDIMCDRTTEYNGLVVSTYNNLIAVDRDKGDYAYQTLGRALADTVSLTELLKSLYQNIGRYHQMAIEMSDANDILKSHFDDFQETVVSGFLHPFKTFDSVPRFKGPILSILNRWYSDEDMIELLSNQGVTYKAAEDIGTARDMVLKMVSELIMHYENLPDIVSEIDKRHNAYTLASVEKIQYLMNRDKSVKGNLVSVIKGLSEDIISSDEVSTGIMTYRQSYISSDSLYSRSKMNKNRVKSETQVRKVDEASAQSAVESFKIMLSESYSREVVYAEMLDLLKDGTVSTDKMPLSTFKDFSRVILATIHGVGRSSPYEVNFFDDDYENEKFKVPMIEFDKK